jgi:hypothetical protein
MKVWSTDARIQITGMFSKPKLLGITNFVAFLTFLLQELFCFCSHYIM